MFEGDVVKTLVYPFFSHCLYERTYFFLIASHLLKSKLKNYVEMFVLPCFHTSLGGQKVNKSRSAHKYTNLFSSSDLLRAKFLKNNEGQLFELNSMLRVEKALWSNQAVVYGFFPILTFFRAQALWSETLKSSPR